VILHLLAVLGASCEKGIFSGRVVPEGTLVIIEDIARGNPFQVWLDPLDEGTDLSSAHLKEKFYF
jgi:hypothetical protein